MRFRNPACSKDWNLLTRIVRRFVTTTETTYRHDSGVRLAYNSSKGFYRFYIMTKPVDINRSFWKLRRNVYLGLTIQVVRHRIEKEANSRIKLDWAAFGRLLRVLSSTIPQSLKTKIFDNICKENIRKKTKLTDIDCKISKLK